MLMGVSLRLRCLLVRHLCAAVLLGLWVCAVEAPSLAYAWPRFLGMGRSSTAEVPSTDGGKPDKTAVPHPALSFPGKAERVGQAHALWQEVEAKGRLSPCWKRSLLYLNAKCAEVQREDTMRSRLALFMATCDADSDGRVHPSFHCGTTATAPSELSADGIRACVRGLSDTAYAAFLQYRLHADVLCAYLQEELYQERTEAAVAAMLQQVEGNTEVLGVLQQSGAEAYTLARETQALQRAAQAATTSLQQQLDALHHGHAAAFQALRVAADDILHTSTRTDAALGELRTHVQEAAEEALTSVQALSHQSLRQFAVMEEQTRGVMQLMEQVDHVQRLLARQSFSWYRVLCVLGWMTAVLVATSLPHTAAARLPAMALALLSTVGLPLLQRWTGQEVWLLLRIGVWQCLCAAWAAGLVCWSACCYTPPEVWQRRVVREEAERVWRELRCSLPAADSPYTTVLQPYVPRAPSPTPVPSQLLHQRLVSPAVPLQPSDNDADRDAEPVATAVVASSPAPRAPSLPPAETDGSDDQCVRTTLTERKRGRAPAMAVNDGEG
ncbi:hypothetical protein ABB37_10074, partial [Leptomonas pyrrhocoris]